MSLKDSCGCPAGRPLGAPHLPECSLAGTAAADEATVADISPRLVSVFRNPETQRPVAVPEEIVSAAEREYRAWKAHTSGKSWVTIAAEEKYDSPEAARESVKRYLAEAVAVVQDFNREQIVADHVGRLALMRSYVWKGVEAGKTASIAQALAIEDRWVKAFGLDQETGEDAATQTVVVIDKEDRAYLQLLQDADAEGNGTTPEASAG